MFPFDTAALCDDDIRVLTAYEAAESEAQAQRRAAAAAKASTEELATHEIESELNEDVDDSPDSIEEQSETGAGAKPKIDRHTWISRIRKIEGVAPDRMAPTHGRLIAHGLLQFQLQSKSEGVVYRVTAFGRKSLLAATEATAMDADAA